MTDVTGIGGRKHSQYSHIVYVLIASLFFLYWINYLAENAIGNILVYAAKDVYIFAIISLIPILLGIKRLTITKTHVYFCLLLAYIMFVSTAQLTNPVFWILGIREMVLLPLAFIFLGYIIAREYGTHGHRRLLIWSLVLTTIATSIFPLLFPEMSYSSTDRLSSFWTSVHLPGILGGLLLVSIVSSPLRWRAMNYILALISISMIVLSGSRSVYGAIFGVFFVLTLYQNPKRTLQFTIVGCIGVVLFLSYYQMISPRPLAYNLSARFEQWRLAANVIRENPFFGFGIDKYGVVGPFRLVYERNGMSTTTMDSSLIKYAANLGVIFIVGFFAIVLQCLVNINNSHIPKSHMMLFSTVIIYSIIIGSVTGKLGAFPLNMYFYTTLGVAMTIPIVGINKLNSIE